MKKFAIVAALAFMVSTAAAQAEPGDAGIFGDPAGTLTTANPAPFAPAFLYVVAFDVPGGVFAYEAGTQDLVAAGATILGATFAGPGPLNVGDNAAGNFIVGAGGCVDAQGPITLVSVNFLLFAPPAADTAICLRGTTPSSFDGGLPGYSDCDARIFPFGVATNGQGIYPDGCLILAATQDAPVSTENATFGDVKARF